MHILKTIFNAIFSLFKILILWIIFDILVAFISIFFNISIETSEQIIVGILFILFGIFGITVVKKIFKTINERDSILYKIISLLFSYIAPICSIFIGISLLLNLVIY